MNRAEWIYRLNYPEREEGNRPSLPLLPFWLKKNYFDSREIIQFTRVIFKEVIALCLGRYKLYFLEPSRSFIISENASRVLRGGKNSVSNSQQ